jgi:hypothetical protein
MADKAALELIGVLLFIATLFVLSAGGFVVRYQLATGQHRIETAEFTRLAGRMQPMHAGTTPAGVQDVK